MSDKSNVIHLKKQSEQTMPEVLASFIADNNDDENKAKIKHAILLYIDENGLLHSHQTLPMTDMQWFGIVEAAKAELVNFRVEMSESDYITININSADNVSRVEFKTRKAFYVAKLRELAKRGAL